MTNRGGKSVISVPAVYAWVESLPCSDEPPLDELLDDPIIQMVMESDGVAREAVTELIVAGTSKGVVLQH